MLPITPQCPGRAPTGSDPAPHVCIAQGTDPALTVWKKVEAMPARGGRWSDSPWPAM